MTPSPEPQSGKLPVPVPPDSPAPETGKLKALLRQRFFLVALVVIVFLGILFSLESFKKPSPPPEPSPHGPEAPLALKPPEPSPQGPKTPPAVKPPEPPAGVQPEASPPPEHLAEPAAPKLPEHPAKPAAPAIPTPPPTPVPAGPPVKGEVFARALVKILDDQVNQRLFGWRPNTIVFGKFGLTDDINNLQLGVLEVARRTVVVLNENMTRFAVTESYNPQVNEAMNFIMVSPHKYWFPSASGKYREAMLYLNQYIAYLKLGRSRFYTRVDNLIALLANYKDILGSCFHNLLKDTEADGSPVSWFKADDYFYFSKGVAIAMAEMLEAVKEDFHDQLQKKGSHKLLDDAIHALHGASHLSPWIVFDAPKDGLLANHRANMSTYIGEAEHLVATLQTVLATN